MRVNIKQVLLLWVGLLLTVSALDAQITTTAGTMTWEDDGSGTTTIVNFPTNNVGDVLIAFIGESNNPGRENLGHSAAGWSSVVNTATRGSTWPSGLYVAWRPAPVGGLTTETFLANNITGYIAWGLVLQGVDTLAPIEAVAVATASAVQGQSVTAPATATTTDSSVVVWLMNKGGANETYTSIPGTVIITGSSSEPGRGTGLVWAQTMFPSSREVDAKTFTWAGDVQSSVAATLVLRPSAPVSSTPPLPPYSSVATVEQVLDSLWIRVRVGTPWDGISVVDSIVVSHRTNELALVQFATGLPTSTLIFQIPAPPTGVVYSGSYTATAFRDCATVANCTSVATSPPWRFAGQGPLPPEDLATWSNPEPPVRYNEPLAIDMVPASVSDCSSIGMRYWTRPAGTVGVMDTMRIHIITPGANGCTFFIPRNSATASLFFRTYFDDFMAMPSGDTQIPTSPIIISTDTLSP